MRRTYQDHQSSLGAEAAQQMSALARLAHETLTAIADKFRPQLLGYFQEEGLPESNVGLCQRIVKAGVYFNEKLAAIEQEAKAIPRVTDNQAVAQSIGVQMEQLQRLLFVKQASFYACSQGFSTVGYKRAQFDAEFDFNRKRVNLVSVDVVPAGVPHPELYAELLQYRQEMADKHNISQRAVLTSQSIQQLVSVMPTSQKTIQKIHGIARKRLERYGKDIEAMIRKYCEANQIALDRPPHSSRSPLDVGTNTRQITMDMFEAGKTVEEIAQERGLKLSTIQGHLAHNVEEKQLDICRVMDRAKVEEIEQYLLANPEATMSEVKTHFGTKYDYGELRLAQSHLRSRVV